MPNQPGERFTLENAPEWAHQPDLETLLRRNRETESTNLWFQQEHDLLSRGRFIRNIYRLDSPEMVQAATNVEFDLDPTRFRLAVHHIRVIRDGEVVSQAEEDEFRFIQPEESRHSLVFDGRYIVIHLIEDARPGDIIDVASTTYNLEPDFPGQHYGYMLACALAGSDFVRAALHVPPGVHVRHVVHGGTDRFQCQPDDAGGEQLLLESSDEKPRKFSHLAPSWFRQAPSLSWSTYESWEQVSAEVAALWERELGSDPAHHELDTCLASLGLDDLDQTAHIDKIIRFVQSDIRYLSLSEGIYSLVPRHPERVLRKRFGDCKDKSILLSLLLRRIGGTADPALVNTTLREKTTDTLPAPGAFDHAIVHLQHEGRDYWIDPTATGQGGTLATRQTYRFAKALPVRIEGAAFYEVTPSKPASTSIILNENIHLEGEQLRIEIETVAEGLEADTMRMQRSQRGNEQYAEALREFTSRFYPNAVIANPLAWEDDPLPNRVRMIESYHADAVIEQSPIPAMGPHYPITPVIIGSRLLILEKGDIPDSPMALPFPLNLVHHIHFHHNLPKVMWDRTEENIKGPGFEYALVCTTKKKEAEFRFTYRNLTTHLEREDLPTYRKKIQDVCSSLGRGIPVRKTSTSDKTIVVVAITIALYLALRAWIEIN